MKCLQRRHAGAGFEPGDVGRGAAGEGELALGEPGAVAGFAQTLPDGPFATKAQPPVADNGQI